MAVIHSSSCIFYGLISGFFCLSLIGCGNDLSLPKAAAETAAPPASTPTTNISPVNLQAASQNPTIGSTESPPEKTSVWVTLAGMKCH